jgi:hypothetical protein
MDKAQLESARTHAPLSSSSTMNSECISISTPLLQSIYRHTLSG